MSKGYSFNKIDINEVSTLKGIPGLKAYLGNVAKGQSDVYTVPFALGESTQTLLSEWDKILVSISDDWPSLYQFESDLREKVGPLSVMKPLDQRLDDIKHYYTDIQLSGIPVLDIAISAVSAEWAKGNPIQVKEMSRTVVDMKKSTNSGLPYFTKRRNVVDRTVPCNANLAGKWCIQNLQGSSWKTGAVIGWRGQEGGYSKSNVKQRVVWMFPFGVNIREAQVYQPLISAAKKRGCVPAWISMDAVDTRITQMFDTKGSDDMVVCTDFTKFDQHFNDHLSDVARRILANMLRANQSSLQWLSDIFPIKYNIPLLITPTTIVMGKHGMGSGSGGTNADETIAHRALQYEAAIRHGARLNIASQCLGDDGVLTYPGINAEDVTSTYTSHGLEMNPEKQYESKDDCVYLRRWHHTKYRFNNVCVGVYSTFRALGRLRYIERKYDPEVWSNKAVALRQLSILENVKYHPLRNEFAEFCMKRDKYRLGIDIPHFLDNIRKYAQEMIDYIPDFLGYTRSLGEDPVGGIEDWWIVQYLKSKA